MRAVQAVVKLGWHSFTAVDHGSSSYQSFPQYLNEVADSELHFPAESIGSHAI